LASGARDRTSESPIRTLQDIKDDLEVIKEMVQSTPVVTESLTLPTSISLQRSAEHVLTAQHEDPCLRAIRRAFVTPGHNGDTKGQHRAALAAYAVREDGLLVKLLHGPAFQPKQVICIPDKLVEDAIFSCHKGFENGHPGFVRTYQKVFDRYHWVGMYGDVKRHVEACPVCQMHGRAPSQAPIVGHITADAPGRAWVMDVLHMLPSAEGHVAVLVAVDVFSRYCVLMPMFSIDSEEATELAKLHVITGPGGVPRWILTDNGAEFKGEFNEFCVAQGIEHRTSAPGHSQSHGMVERLVATTELTLAHFIDDDMAIWHKVVSHAQLTHNSTPHPALSAGLKQGYTPAEVFLGRKLATR